MVVVEACVGCVAVGAAAGAVAEEPGCGAGTLAASSTWPASPTPLEASSLAASFWLLILASSS